MFNNYSENTKIKSFNTVKILKFWTRENIAVITLKFEQAGSTIE